jgi:hypothetical protein
MTKREKARATLVAVTSTPNMDFGPLLDAFESAVRAEALVPRERSPELAEAERQLRMRSNVQGCHGAEWAAAISAELDRLRAENSTLRAQVQRLHNAEVAGRGKGTMPLVLKTTLRPRTE